MVSLFRIFDICKIFTFVQPVFSKSSWNTFEDASLKKTLVVIVLTLTSLMSSLCNNNSWGSSLSLRFNFFNQKSAVSLLFIFTEISCLIFSIPARNLSCQLGPWLHFRIKSHQSSSSKIVSVAYLNNSS